MGKKIYCVRYGAFGDLLYLLPTLGRLRANGNTLYLFSGQKGREIYGQDSRFGGLLFADEGFHDIEGINKLLADDMDRVEPDEVINFQATLEGSLIFQDANPPYHWPVEKRRELNKDLSFYDLPMIVAEVQMPPPKLGECGSMAFTDMEVAWAESWREQLDGRFVVCMPLAGSMQQKRFVHAKSVAKSILDRYPDAAIFPLGDKGTLLLNSFSFGDGRVYYPKSPYTLRQSILMTRYADFVIGPETGLMVGAGMWGTPKTILCTSSSINQCVGHQRNDFSIMAAIDCAPCLRAIYVPKDCGREKECLEDGTCPCNFKFDVGEILEPIDLVYRTMRYRRDKDAELRTEPFRVSGVRPDFVRHPKERGNIRPEVSRSL